MKYFYINLIILVAIIETTRYFLFFRNHFLASLSHPMTESDKSKLYNQNENYKNLGLNIYYRVLHFNPLFFNFISIPQFQG